MQIFKIPDCIRETPTQNIVEGKESIPIEPQVPTSVPSPSCFSPRNSDAFFERFRLSRGSLPSSVDSVAENLVTDVKDQGFCGSCAAFSTVSLLETCMLTAKEDIATDKQDLDLSEQDLLDCAFDNR